MPSLALKPLPTDEKSEKLRIDLTPVLGEDLRQYQAAYEDQYGSKVPLSALVPAILEQFLEKDRAFKQWKKTQINGTAV